MLVVDDEPRVLVFLSVMLTDFCIKNMPQGGQVDTCSSGEQALKLLAANEYDFLLADIIMPTMDGLTLLQQAHLRHPNLWYGILTGTRSERIITDAQEIGALFVLSKPFDIDQLKNFVLRVARIRRAISKAKANFLPSSEKDVIFTDVPELVSLASKEGKKRNLLRTVTPDASATSQALFPFIIGGLLHNSMNALLGLDFAIRLSSQGNVNAQGVLQKRTVPSLVPALEQLEVMLQLMQELTRGFYTQSKGAMPSTQVATIVKTMVMANPKIRYDSEIDPVLDQLPMPVGVSEFVVGELIKNATKACEGYAESSVSLKVMVDQSRDTISYECRNSGNSFSAEKLEEIRGQQLRPPEQRKTGGYGLYLIQELAMRLHGSLLVSNLAPSGARVQALLTTKVKEQ